MPTLEEFKARQKCESNEHNYQPVVVGTMRDKMGREEVLHIVMVCAQCGEAHELADMLEDEVPEENAQVEQLDEALSQVTAPEVAEANPTPRPRGRKTPVV